MSKAKAKAESGKRKAERAGGEYSGLSAMLDVSASWGSVAEMAADLNQPLIHADLRVRLGARISGCVVNNLKCTKAEYWLLWHALPGARLTVQRAGKGGAA